MSKEKQIEKEQEKMGEFVEKYKRFFDICETKFGKLTLEQEVEKAIKLFGLYLDNVI